MEKAAQKRITTQSSSTKIVAGPGRSVTITEEGQTKDGAAEGGQSTSKKRIRSKKKEWAKEGDDLPSQGSAHGLRQDSSTKPPKKNLPKNKEGPKVNNPPPSAVNPQKSQVAQPAGDSTSAPSRGTVSRRGRGRGGGSGGGVGGAAEPSDKDRSAHNTVVQILRRNDESASRRGGAPRGARSNGAGVPVSLDPRNARIDA
jgi:hypothetical protein